MKIKHIVTILGLALSFSTIIPTINSNALSKTIVNVPSKFNNQDEFDAFVVALKEGIVAKKGIHFVKNSNPKPDTQNTQNEKFEESNTINKNTQINNIPEIENKANHNFDTNLYYKMRNQVREENGVSTLQSDYKLEDFATQKAKSQAQYYKETKILSHEPYGDNNFVYLRTFAKGESGEITTLININSANGENEKRVIQNFIKSSEHNRISLKKI